MRRHTLSARALSACALLTFACEATPADEPARLEAAAQPVIYGEDDRRDHYDLDSGLWRDLVTESAVALVAPDRLIEVDGGLALTGAPLGESLDLCEGARFATQLRGARCSGVLIDDDLVLTAGHCVDDLAECQETRFVFDHRLIDPDTPAPIDAADVFGCAALVARLDDGDTDFALIRLDRAATPARTPAAVRPGDLPLEIGAAVTLIGAPNGLPIKVAAGGQVVRDRADWLDYFEATVDAFGGNSGSGVFDAAGAVVGVLVRGERDYTQTDDGCSLPNVLPAEGLEDGAEDITYVARAIEALCATGTPDAPASARLCAGGDRGWCFPCADADDCAAGWRCGAHAQDGRVTFCAPACEADADCRADHQCLEGLCAPILSRRCDASGVEWVDACGRRLDAEARCEDDERCLNGVCQPEQPGDRCEAALPLTPGETITGRLDARFADDVAGSCGGEGPDQIFTITVDALRPLQITASGFDTVLHLRKRCEGPELACVDDSTPPGGRGSQLDLTLASGTYFVFLDAYRASGGDYTLSAELGAPCALTCAADALRCGDEGPEICVATPGLCPTWSPQAPCSPDQRCEAGQCVAQPDMEIPDAELPDMEIADAARPDMEIADAGLADGDLADSSAPDVSIDASVSDMGGDNTDGGAGDSPRGGGCHMITGGANPGALWLIFSLLLGATAQHRRRRGR